MRAILDFIRPPEDADWRAVNRWRWNVTLSLLAIALILSYAATPWGVVMAHDQDRKITEAVEKKIAPIVTEQRAQGAALKHLTSQQDAMTKLLLENLAESTAAKIRLIIAKRCRLPTFDPGRESLNEELRKLEKDYISYAGEAYEKPNCTEI